MSKKIIAKFCSFVIFAGAAAGCSDISQGGPVASPAASYKGPRVSGNIKTKGVEESSGLVASQCQENVLWTHNDSGDDAYLYAVAPDGADLGTFRVPAISNVDWEDIALRKGADGLCYLYIAETGNNKGKRPDHAIYRIAEPKVGPETRDSSRKEPVLTAEAAELRFRYPDYDQDAEALLVEPVSGSIYVLTKRVTGASGIYKLKSDASGSNATAEHVGELSVPAIPNGFLTGGDISADGRRVIICDYTQGYEYVLPDGALSFDAIWKQDPEVIDLGKRKGGESVCYSRDGQTIFAGSEGKQAPIYAIERTK